MLEKFNIYDLVANLIPGALFFWSLELLCRMTAVSLPLPFKDSGQWDLKEASMLVVLCYVAGLLWQALSVLTVEKFMKWRWGGGFISGILMLPGEKQSLPAATQARIRALAAERFQIAPEAEIPPDTKPKQARRMRLGKNQEIFFLCFSYVFSLSPRPQVFNSQYCQFRCLTAIFGFFTLAALAVGIAHPPGGGCSDCWKVWVFAGIYAGCTWLFYRSCDAYGWNFAGSVYDLFVAGVAKMPEKE